MALKSFFEPVTGFCAPSRRDCRCGSRMHQNGNRFMRWLDGAFSKSDMVMDLQKSSPKSNRRCSVRPPTPGTKSAWRRTKELFFFFALRKCGRVDRLKERHEDGVVGFLVAQLFIFAAVCFSVRDKRMRLPDDSQVSPGTSVGWVEFHLDRTLWTDSALECRSSARDLRPPRRRWTHSTLGMQTNRAT